MNIKDNMLMYESYLNEYASKNKDAIRLEKIKKDIRGEYYRDIDRIIHSLSYTRYSDKTQVFSNNSNDNITHRIIHVQLVSKIARTIGRALRLNEDLIEAISLGHDLGHVPCGHVGESILNEISLEHNEGYFIYTYKCKRKEDFLSDYNNSYKDKKVARNLIPMTLEACVVRISDIIGYIGRDLEDAIEVGKIKRKDIPKNIVDYLGNNNASIVNTLILDIINNSYNKNCIELSNNVYDALNDLIKFNYDNIYLVANSKDEIEMYKFMFKVVFNKCLYILNNKFTNYNIYKCFLNKMSADYIDNNTNERIIIDYIAGMTDNYFINEFNILKKI